MNSNRTWLAAAMVAAIGLHFVPFTMYLSPDLHQAYRPWYYHLLEKGFSEPISNYSPPYLYLLWGLTRFDGIFWPNVMIKLLSLSGAFWVAYSASRVLGALGRPRELGLLCFILPSIILNTSVLSQVDTFWVAPCLLATAAAIEGKHARVSAWAGLAFAIKAQAAFFAPFVILLFVRRRVPPAIWLIAPIVFVAAMVPAWLGGWKASYIASIYLGQVNYMEHVGKYFIGSSASLWTPLGFLAPKLVFDLRWLGLPFILAGLAFYWRYAPTPNARNIVRLAAISAAGMPFLLPHMLDRFFILADVLAFLYAVAYPSRRTLIAAAAMQFASAWPMAVWAFFYHPWTFVAAPFAVIMLVLLWRDPEDQPQKRSLSREGAVTAPALG